MSVMSVNRGYNDLKVKSFKYEWTIKKFVKHVALWLPDGDPLCYRTIVKMKSPSFTLDDNHTKWYLGLSINPYTYTKTTGYSIDIWGEFQGENPELRKKMEIRCKIVKNNSEEEYNGNNMYHIFSCRDKCYTNTRLATIPNELLVPSNIVRPDYDITIICDFDIVVDSFTSATNNSVSRVAKRNLPIDIEELFINKKFTDITFILGDKKFQAHKIILMARSSVFAAMFSHSMKEQNDNEVQIDDIDYEIFEEILRYIYTDDVSNLAERPVAKLLYAAEKYELEDLKETCGALLQKEITIENAAETFIIADRYNLSQLSEQIRRFIRDHIEDFLNTLGYDSMVDKYPELAKKVFKSPARKV